MANDITYSGDAVIDALKVPPHSIEAEQSVLGGLLLDNSSWDEVADILIQKDFYRQDHQLLFRGISQLFDEAQPVDVVTLAEWHDKQGELDQVGELAYIGSLAVNTPSAANIVTYAKIVRDRSILRQLITATHVIANDAFKPGDRKIADILDKAERQIFNIAEKGAKQAKDFVQVKELLPDVTVQVEALSQQDDLITGVATGFADFDRETLGLQNSDLIIVAGRPSMGKTAFAMNMAEHAAIKDKKHVAVFSMEMSSQSLVMRLLSSVGPINHSHLRSGKLDDWRIYTSASNMLSDAPIFIYDTPAITVAEVRSLARRLKREHDLDMIVIDYIQLMQGSGKASENRATELSEISRGLKSLARELDVPVVALSQLNRSLEARPNKRPMMSDLRESGAIEQDADLIVFIYRDEFYNEASTESGKAEIIIAKQRNGPIGTVRLTFQGQYTRFQNLASHSYDDYGGE